MPLFSPRKKTQKKQDISCTAVIAAAGSSSRMGAEDKLFIDIHGIPVLAHTLMAFENCVYISEIIIVAREQSIQLIGDICSSYNIDKASQIVFGGETRLHSVLNGVLAVSDSAEIIAIHDGARPCISTEIIERTIESAKKYHAAAPAVPVSSTLKRVKSDYILETVDRDSLFEVQTPQVFDADLIKAALSNAKNKSIGVTDDCQAVEIIGATVRIIEGSRLNIKLTTPEDIAIAQAILKGAEATQKES